MVDVVNVFSKIRSAPNGLKIGYNYYHGISGTNPASDLLSDLAVLQQTAINVFLEANTAPNGLKLASYSTFGLLSTNPCSVSLPDFIWRSRCRS